MGLRSIVRKWSLFTLNSVSHFYKATGVPILTYHSIDDSGSRLSTPPALFSRQMKFLKEKNYRVISLRTLVEYFCRHTAPPPGSVVLTFDDGYRSNYEEAFPILKSLDFTATFFVVTHYVGKESTWLMDDPSFVAPMMSWKEIRDMAAHGMDILPHSCTHPHLLQLSKEKMEEEIIESRRSIEDAVKKKAEIFCYPYGEFNDTCIQLLSQFEFRAAVTIRFGRKNSLKNVYALQRVGSAHFQDMTAFKVCLFGLYDWYLRAKELGVRRDAGEEEGHGNESLGCPSVPRT